MTEEFTKFFAKQEQAKLQKQNLEQREKKLNDQRKIVKKELSDVKHKMREFHEMVEIEKTNIKRQKSQLLNQQNEISEDTESIKYLNETLLSNKVKLDNMNKKIVVLSSENHHLTKANEIAQIQIKQLLRQINLQKSKIQTLTKNTTDTQLSFSKDRQKWENEELKYIAELQATNLHINRLTESLHNMQAKYNQLSKEQTLKTDQLNNIKLQNLNTNDNFENLITDELVSICTKFVDFGEPNSNIVKLQTPTNTGQLCEFLAQCYESVFKNIKNLKSENKLIKDRCQRQNLDSRKLEDIISQQNDRIEKFLQASANSNSSNINNINTNGNSNETKLNNTDKKVHNRFECEYCDQNRILKQEISDLREYKKNCENMLLEYEDLINENKLLNDQIVEYKKQSNQLIQENKDQSNQISHLIQRFKVLQSQFNKLQTQHDNDIINKNDIIVNLRRDFSTLQEVNERLQSQINFFNNSSDNQIQSTIRKLQKDNQELIDDESN